jgi:flagellar protein FliS
MSTKPYEKYKQVQVTSANPAHLILMLYDGTIKHLHLAKTKMEEMKTCPEEDKLRLLEESTNHLLTAQRGVSEMKRSLRRDLWEGADTLYALYNYLFFRLVDANMKKDLAPIEEAIRILSELRDAWAQAAEIYRKTQPQPGAAPQVRQA